MKTIGTRLLLQSILLTPSSSPKYFLRASLSPQTSVLHYEAHKATNLEFDFMPCSIRIMRAEAFGSNSLVCIIHAKNAVVCFIAPVSGWRSKAFRLAVDSLCFSAGNLCCQNSSAGCTCGAERLMQIQSRMNALIDFERESPSQHILQFKCA